MNWRLGEKKLKKRNEKLWKKLNSRLAGTVNTGKALKKVKER